MFHNSFGSWIEYILSDYSQRRIEYIQIVPSKKKKVQIVIIRLLFYLLDLFLKNCDLNMRIFTILD